MKHLKLFESVKKYKYKIGDTVICVRKDLIQTRDTPIPIYGNPYIITNISQDTYLEIIDPNTNQNLGSWHRTVFTPEYKWLQNKFNL